MEYSIQMSICLITSHLCFNEYRWMLSATGMVKIFKANRAKKYFFVKVISIKYNLTYRVYQIEKLALSIPCLIFQKNCKTLYQ